MSNVTQTGNPRIQLLTDEVIAMYSENHILTDYRDVNLKILTKLEPYKNGIYDQDIFGSMFSDRCNCGNMRTAGIRCPRCGSTLLDEIQSYRRFARIELPVLYSSKFKVDKLIKLLKANFNIVTDFKLPEFEGKPWNDSICLDCLEWSWDKENERLVLSDNITDFSKCSYEGLLKIIQAEFPEMYDEMRAYLNRYVLVIPMALRAPTLKMEGNNRILENHMTSVIYQNILYCVNEYYPETFPTMKDEIGKAMFRGSLRKLISSSLDMLSKLMQSSKANLARYMQSNRLANSGRCTIVPDPTLKADEVVIPIHLMYEACRSEFIQYISDKKNVSIKEAEVIYKTQSDLDEVQNLFKQYIEGEPGKPDTAKHVIINRAPSLYAMSMFSCKVKLTYDYVMKIPQVLCKPTNGDFDGDTFSYYSIPKDMNKMVNDALGAKNRILYQKSHEPLFTPTHEMMQGLIQATRVKIVSKPMVFDSLEDAKQYKKENRDFKYQTLCVINGERTTLGRAILSDLFDKDLNAYLGGFDKFLNGGNVTILYEQLRDKEDRLDRIQKIQEFALLIVTMSGATSISIKDMYIEIDPTYLKKIEAISKLENLDPRSKELKIRDIYREYQEAELKKINPEVRLAVSDSVRAKVRSLVEMGVQQLNVGPNHEFSVAETSLVQGLSPEDYLNHAIEKRSIQDIKQLSVPQSGYVTRQFTYLASEYYFKEGSDENNSGIFLEKYKARGRTTTDGKIVEKSESTDLIKVRSIVTSTLPKGVMTGDMLTNLFEYKVDSKVGMNLMSSLTESLTQSGLALKHGGNLYNLDPSENIVAPEDGKVELGEEWITFTGKTGKVYNWPKGSMCVISYENAANEYKKGQVMIRNYHPVTPSYKLDCVIKLCSARTTNSMKKFATNKKVVCDCYARNDGEITYKLDNGYMRVFIDDVEYDYCEDSLYYYPSGTKVKKYDRICTGVLNMKSQVYKVTDYVELFYFFRKQFEELMNVAPELIELLYVLLIKDNGDGNLEMKSVIQNIYGSDSFFKSLAFGDARKSFQKIDYQGMDFVADPITSVILSLVMNNEIK